MVVVTTLPPVCPVSTRPTAAGSSHASSSEQADTPKISPAGLKYLEVIFNADAFDRASGAHDRAQNLLIRHYPQLAPLQQDAASTEQKLMSLQNRRDVELQERGAQFGMEHALEQVDWKYGEALQRAGLDHREAQFNYQNGVIEVLARND